MNEFKIIVVHYRKSEILDKLFSLTEFKNTSISSFECDIYTFKRKSDAEILKEKQDKDLKHQIEQIENKFDVKLKIEQ